MFSATFVGHQGWLFSADLTQLLVDPLLTESFGHGGVVGKVFPPRKIDFAAFPALTAVLLTHEHEDHFDIPSLNRLNRGIPILLSHRSSTAARRILAQMGFEVILVKAGQTLQLGALEIFLFSPDHVAFPASDEWDVLQYLVRDRARAGSFFSYVDAPPTPEDETCTSLNTTRPHCSAALAPTGVLKLKYLSDSTVSAILSR